MAFRSIQLTAESLYFTIDRLLPLKILYSHGEIWTPYKYIVPWTLPTLYPKRHFDRFSRLFRAHGRDRQTDRQIDHVTASVTIGRASAYCDAA